MLKQVSVMIMFVFVSTLSQLVRLSVVHQQYHVYFISYYKLPPSPKWLLVSLYAPTLPPRKSRFQRHVWTFTSHGTKNKSWIWSNYSDLTRPGPPKGSVLEGKSPYFREIRVGEILFHLARWITTVPSRLREWLGILNSQLLWLQPISEDFLDCHKVGGILHTSLCWKTRILCLLSNTSEMFPKQKSWNCNKHRPQVLEDQSAQQIPRTNIVTWGFPSSR